MSQSKVAFQPRSFSPRRNGLAVIFAITDRQYSRSGFSESLTLALAARVLESASMAGSGPLRSFQTWTREEGLGPLGRGAASAASSSDTRLTVSTIFSFVR